MRFRLHKCSLNYSTTLKFCFKLVRSFSSIIQTIDHDAFIESIEFKRQSTTKLPAYSRIRPRASACPLNVSLLNYYANTQIQKRTYRCATQHLYTWVRLPPEFACAVCIDDLVSVFQPNNSRFVNGIHENRSRSPWSALLKPIHLVVYNYREKRSPL